VTLELQPKQSAAIVSRATELLYGGAAGGGKSHMMRVAAIAWATDIPGLQVFIFRRTFGEVYSEHMDGPTSFPVMLGAWVESKRVTINYSDNKIFFRNGSTIHLCHCQYPKDVYNYQSAEIHVLMIGEAGNWPKAMYTFLRSRVRMIGLAVSAQYVGLFPRSILTANPGGIGHNWLRGGFVDLGPGLHRMGKDEGGMIREYIPAKLEDNPILYLGDPTYEDRLSGIGNAALVRAMRNGDWNIVAGGAFDDLWDEARHVKAPFKIPGSWRIDRSFDWGSSKPFSVGWWAESDGTEATLADDTRKSWPRGTMFRIGEWYGWPGIGHENEGVKLEDVDIGRGIATREKALREFLGLAQAIQPGPADSSIFDADPGKASIAAGIASGFYGRPGKCPDIFTTADKSPGSRVRGLAVVRRYFKASLAERMEEPGLFVFSTCRDGFIRTMPTLARDAKNPDDIDSEAEDHVADECRYRLTAAKYSAHFGKAGAA
jgi:hypothetical protein